MKKIIILSLICVLIGIQSSIAQVTNFTVTGHLSGMTKEDVLVAVNTTGGLTFDTIPVEKGRFVYQGNVSERSVLMMMLSSKKEIAKRKQETNKKGIVMIGHFDLSFYVSPGAEIEVRGKAADFPFVELISADPMNQGRMDLRKQNEKELKRLNELHDVYNEARWAGDTAAKNKVNAELHVLRDKMDERTTAWIAKHPDQEYAIQLYLESGLVSKTVEELQQQYDRFTPAVQQTISGKRLSEMIQVRSALKIGSMAPDFVARNVYSGKDITLQDYRGKYVLLDFWGSWCIPCRNSHPHLIDISRKYEGEQFAILGLAADEQEAVIKEAAKKDGITWPQVSLLEKRKGQKKITSVFDISAFPTKILVDPTGKIVARCVGDAAAIDQKLKEIFGK